MNREDERPLPDDELSTAGLPEGLLEALRGAWRRTPAPPPTPSLAESDDETRRAVAWMADAWAALPSAGAEVPPAVRSRFLAQRRHRRWLGREATRQLAAAALLLGLGLVLWTAAEALPSHGERSRGDLAAGGPRTAPDQPTSPHTARDRDARGSTASATPSTGPGTPTGTGSAADSDADSDTETAPAAATLIAAADLTAPPLVGRAVVAATSEHLELRSGPVRLLLVTSSGAPAAPAR